MVIGRLARELSTRSIVLLRNEGDLLPLPRAGRRLALIGPFAADRANLNGLWSFVGDPSHGIDLALTGAVRDAPALLATWFLGEQTGPAVADILFGAVEPTGRTRPVRQMKAFAHVALGAGEARRVTLTIAHDDLAIVAADGCRRVEPGAFDLLVSAGDDATLTARFTVTGRT